jgi:hypothetical protein
MSDKHYQPPSFRTIIIANVAFLILLGSLCTFPSTVKWVGNVFLYIPSQLGLVRRVMPGEVLTIDLRTASPASLEITAPGQYAVFSASDELLMINTLSGENTGPWLLGITSRTTGEPVEILPVERGIRPYDTPSADGRPIFAFRIDTPGSYEVAHPTKYAFISIVPDYTSGKEQVIVLAYVLQIGILLAPWGTVYFRRYQRQRMQIKEVKGSQVQRRAQGEAFWEAEIRKRKEKTPEKH